MNLIHSFCNRRTFLGGLALGAVGCGALVQLAPFPTQLVFAVLLIGAAIAGVVRSPAALVSGSLGCTCGPRRPSCCCIPG